MAWTNFDLTTVNPNLEIIPEGEYTFSLLGAKYGDRDPNRIEVNAAVASEGDFTGRRIFFSYPDKDRPKCEWSPRMLKRLQMAIGVDPMPFEDPVAYLNRVAGNRFSAPVKHSKPTEDYPNPRAEVDIFNVRPAA